MIDVISFKIPLKSAPKGGTPPVEIGINVSGGKPSCNDARPFTMPICEAVGMGVVISPAPAAKPKGTGIFIGMVILIL